MMMPGRTYTAGTSYRYGFNGKENDNEVKGEGNTLDFGARIYDSRLGRWLSGDPLEAKYPMHSPYNYAANNPNLFIDRDGNDWIISISQDKSGNITVHIKLTAVIVNSSGKQMDLNKFKAAVINQLKTNFEKVEYKKAVSYTNRTSNLDGVSVGGPIPDKMVNVTVKFEADIRIVTNKAQQYELSNISKLDGQQKLISLPKDPTYSNTRRNDEHLIEIKSNSELPGLYGKVNKIGGKELFLNENFIDKIIKGSDNNTVFHELGHSLGLRHIDPLFETFSDILNGGNPQRFNQAEQNKSPNNAMYTGGSGKLNDSTSTDLTPKQFEKALENHKNKKINKN